MNSPDSGLVATEQAELTLPADAEPGGYRSLLRDDAFRGLLLSSAPGRMGFSMSTLALVLLLTTRPGGLAVAGLATGAFAAGNALLAPLRGRMVDRHGRPALLVMAAGTRLGTAVLASWSAPSAAAVVLAVLTGALLPPVSAVARAAVPARKPPTVTARTAFALDGSLEEVLYVVGPAAAALLFPVFGNLVLPGTATLMLVSCILLPLSPAAVVATGKPASRRFRLPENGRREVASLVAAVVSGGLLLGVLTITVPAAAEDARALSASGVLLTCLTAGSAVGGLLFGLWSWRMHGPRLAGCLALALAVTSVPPFFVPLGDGARMAPVGALLAVCGLMLSPLMVTAFGHVYVLLGERAGVAAFAWLSTGKNLGVAVGAAGGGLLVTGLGVRNGAVLAAAAAAAVAMLGLALAGKEPARNRVPENAASPSPAHVQGGTA